MKLLKCEDNTCYLNVNGKDKKILEINKEDILNALEYIYDNEDVGME